MKFTSYLGIASLSSSLLLSAAAFAQQPRNAQQPQGWMWGFGVAASQDVYTDFDNRIVPIPIIGYTGEKLRVYGPFVGYQLFQQDGFTLDAQLVPVFAGYEEDDSAVFTGMEDRDFSYAAGIGLNYNTGGWVYSLSTSADILGKFDGYQASARIGKRFRIDQYMIEPSIGVNYQDSNYVDYYYGVRPEEATAFRSAYNGDGALNTEIRIAVSTRQFFKGITRLELGATFFDDSISDSPLTDDDTSLNAMLVYTRFF
ncbi:MipA/OmpV family protein [Alteromonas sp. OM2203]|uniref:MipA/OmpV family protein n=1 Tax=Alteromonas sp. OM2203 TaxID=3398817 RepID=UPI003AF3BC57